MEKHSNNIRKLLTNSNFPESIEIKELPSSGSDRLYFRIFFATEFQKSILASFNPDVSENIAWNSFSAHFHKIGLNVPEVYARDESYRYFLLQDLGDETLFGLLNSVSEEKLKKLYELTIKNLVKFQVQGIKGLDLEVAYPVKEFNKRSILWDLNYFKYYFVKPNNVSFNEDQIEDEFQTLADQLLEPKQDYFLYRDFQTRNILIHQDKLWFIDFQGGRKGPLQYDLVSLLYQAKANLSNQFRNDILEKYLAELEKEIPGSRTEFLKDFHYFIYFRLMQVLGAYGFRGIIQRKGHFLESISYALKSLDYLTNHQPLSNQFKNLKNIFDQLILLGHNLKSEVSPDKLTVLITSFSYKKSGYPVDLTENGGGFVFDCRSLPNPGRIADLKEFTGREKPVVDYLSTKPEIKQFLEDTFHLIDQSIDNYLDRGFNYLTVNFGCTGGKHRSVYSAESLKRHLYKYQNQLNVIVKHIQIDG